ncbi:MAG: hypothetical protein AAB263_00270, partial [Planctomycetota bacterium]
RTLLARLPATTLLALAWGFDGKAYWKAESANVLAEFDKALLGGSAGPEATAKQIQEMLKQFGVEASVQELIEGLTGTGFVAVTQGVPFPALTIALPRSKAMDQLITAGLQQLDSKPPDEGQSGAIMLPNIPLPITVVRDKAAWVVTTDPMLAGSWSSGAAGGFAESTMAKTLYAKAPAHASLLGASDTPALLRTIQGYLGMALPSLGLGQDEQQAINTALTKLSMLAATGYLYQAVDAKGLQFEVRGLVGLGLVPISATAAMYGMRSSSPAEVALAAASAASAADEGALVRLSTQLFAAEFQFQGGAYCDQDGNGVGEYGTLAELTGKLAAPGQKQSETLVEGFTDGASVSGYTYAIFLPDGKGAALTHSDKARTADKAAAKEQEKHFVIYAWPEQADARMFAIDQNGVVYERPATGKAPAWNELYDGKGWDQKPTWQPTQR